MRWFCSAMVLALGIALFVERAVFTDPLALNDDIQNQIYWMARLGDPALFPGDLIADYFAQPSLVSPVLWGLYALLAPWVSPERLSQVLPFVAVLLATVFLFRYVETVAGSRQAFWVTVVFNGFVWSVKNLAGGLPRAFCYPLLFFFLWRLALRQRGDRNGWPLMAGLWLAALLYPPALLLSLGVLVWDLGPGLLKKETGRSALRLLVLGGGGSLVLLAFRYLLGAGDAVGGPLTTGAEAMTLPEVYAQGRVVLFPYATGPWPDAGGLNGIVWAVVNRLPHPYLLIPGVLLALSASGSLWFVKRSPATWPVPGQIWRLLGVSIVLYGLAWDLLFSLYVPERYLQFSLPLIFVFLAGGGLCALDKAKPWGRIGGVALVLALAGGFWRSDLMAPSTDTRALTGYLRSLPRETLIAANPGLSDKIPLYARRSVLVSREAYIPFHREFFAAMKGRLRDWLLLCYATDPSALPPLVKRYGIRVLVVDENDYERHRLVALEKNHFRAFAPAFFERLAARGLRGHPAKPYALQRILPRCQAFQAGQYTVVRGDRLLRGDCFAETDRKAGGIG